MILISSASAESPRALYIRSARAQNGRQVRPSVVDEIVDDCGIIVRALGGDIENRGGARSIADGVVELVGVVGLFTVVLELALAHVGNAYEIVVTLHLRLTEQATNDPLAIARELLGELGELVGAEQP